MKSSTPDCMKFRRLQRRLHTSKCVTVGLLELLWLATAKNCPEGDIGRFTDEEIAIECDWEGDPSILIEALVDCGWLDVHDGVRLVVHDWADHCPTHVGNSLRRWGKSFIVSPKESPKHVPRESPKDDPKEPPKDVPPNLAKPNLTKPDLTQPNQNTLAAAKAADCQLDFSPLEGTGRVSAAADKLSRSLAKRKIDLPADWIWANAALGELLKPGFVADASAKIIERQIAKPKSYIEKALREECAAVGVSLGAAIKCVPPRGVKECTNA